MTDLYGAVMAWSNLQFGYGLGLTNPIACKYTMNTSAERLALSKNKIVGFFPLDLVSCACSSILTVACVSIDKHFSVLYSPDL